MCASGFRILRFNRDRARMDHKNTNFQLLKFVNYVNIFVIATLLIHTLVVSGFGEPQCYSFADGHVYPQETAKTSGHTLQWTKAMSKCSQVVSFQISSHSLKQLSCFFLLQQFQSRHRTSKAQLSLMVHLRQSSCQISRGHIWYSSSTH